jgi:chemotaxis signal transduction protein
VSSVLVVSVGGSWFALPLERVVEVVRMVALAPVPESAPWVVGMADVRGRHVPVIELGRRLGVPGRPPDIHSRIVVAAARLRPPGQDRLVGLVVDDAVSVTTVGVAERAPSASSLVHRSFRSPEGQLVMVLDEAVLDVA